jgi:hypothetical protein
MYIRYTFFLLLDKAALQTSQILGAITLPVSLLLAVIALSIRLRHSFKNQTGDRTGEALGSGFYRSNHWFTGSLLVF